jgi:hypothetical protein
MAPKTLKNNNSKHICLALNNHKCQNNMHDVFNYHKYKTSVCET